LLSLTLHWETLVEWLDSEGMAGDLIDEKWRDRDERRQGIDHIIDVLERWTLTHTIAELEEKGQLMHFPWAGVKSVPQLLASPQLEERSYFAEIGIARTGKRYRAPGAAVKMRGLPWQPGGRLAFPGESNRDVFQGELGLTRDEMEELSTEGVI
jgi:crotonobetainyl-CoA:carnitine CoA-transferase CaiB-like acyl-CoA transferase